MRRFKSTPQKKFIGMTILFVLIPLFLLLYVLFVIDWRPSSDTLIIAAAIAILFLYLYSRYKKQAAGQPATMPGEPPGEETAVEGAATGEAAEEEPAEEATEELPREEGGETAAEEGQASAKKPKQTAKK